MSGIAQRDRRKPRRLAFLDADPDRLRRHGLAIAEFAVDHRKRWRIDHDVDGLIGHHGTDLVPADIDRHPDHAVAVMAGEVGRGQIAGNAAGFLGRRAGLGKHLGHEIDQMFDVNGNH